MGVHIHIRHEQDMACVEWWDSIRYAGDHELISDPTIQWERKEDEFGDEIRRPVDFDAIRTWVNSRLVVGNRKRWLDAIERMESDPTLWIEVIY